MSQRKLKNVNKSLRLPPHFPHLFILAAEVLAKTVRNNKSIRGFSLGNDEVKISQYADDTTLILTPVKYQVNFRAKTLDLYMSKFTSKNITVAMAT